MARGPRDGWIELDGAMHAWFASTCHSDGARLTEAFDAPVEVRIRSTGVLVSTVDADLALVDGVAARMGLRHDPAGLRRLRIVLETADPAAAAPFWDQVAGQAAPELRRVDAIPPLRNRLHLDVVRPASVVQGAKAAIGRAPHGAYGLTLADAEGNEVDLVPGDPLGDDPQTADWSVVFAASVVYPTLEPRDVVGGIATLAEATIPSAAIDILPGSVRISGVKDQTDGPMFDLFAKGVQRTARRCGLSPDPAAPTFVQALIDAVDVDAVRSWWASVLGYERVEGNTDLVDPRGLGPVLLFQPMEADDVGRRGQRDRFHLELDLPASEVPAMLDAATALGGRVIDGHVLVDPEGNELVLRPG